eukprot:12696395-Ditylum_brightwellii.AAC.1
MPTIETVKTSHDKAATTTYSIATVKNTQQSTSSGLTKKTTKHQRRVSSEMATGITMMGMTVTRTIMTAMGMLVMAYISRLVLEDTNLTN